MSPTRTEPVGNSSAPPPDAAFSNQEASPQQVKQWMDAGACVVVDVREADEHAREHIRGARLLPLSRFDGGTLATLAGSARRIVLHCKSGRRGADACRMAGPPAQAGVEVVNMAGGIEAWKKAALPVELDTRVSGISVMRQVQLVIGLGVLAGCGLSWFVDPRFLVVPAFFGAGLTFAGASGTCAMATLIGKLPWNRAATP